jgi:hypothetical protein
LAASRSDTAPEAGAPGDEIEVTPEMIEAGVDAYIENDRFFHLPEEIVRNIFIAMQRAKRQ